LALVALDRLQHALGYGYRKIKRPFPPTPARGEPVRPAPAAGQPCRQLAGHRPAPQGTDRTGSW
jgi:hypothetical protein